MAVSLASLAFAAIPILTPCFFDTFSPASAASKKEKKDKSNGNGNGNGNGNSGANSAGGSNGNGGGNGNAGGNGNGNGNGNGKKGDSGASVDNGITSGNGLAIGLGEGVGLGVGIGDDDTIGVGIGMSLDDDGREHRSLESTDRDRDGPKGGKADRNDWSPGKGEKVHKGAGEDIDFGKQFEGDRIRKELGHDLNELGKLLTDGDGKDVLPGHGAADDRSPTETLDAADIGGKAAGKEDVRGNTTKVDDSAGGKVTGRDKAKDDGSDKALAKAARKEDKEERKEAKREAKEARKEAKEASKAEKHANKNKGTDEEVGQALNNAPSEAAGRDNPSGGPGSIAVDPASYIAQEVLALGLSPTSIGRVRQLGFGVGETGLEQQAGAILTLSAPTGIDALRAITLLRRELPRDAFHLNRIYRPYNTATDDPAGKDAPADQPNPGNGRCVGDKCYGRGAIGWNERLADCARNINIGIIDTDVDLRHPAFAGQKITRKAFFADGRQSSANGHGTGVLALLAGRPDSNTPGLIPEAQFFFANIFFTDTNGETITDTVSLLKALDWMSASRAQVVNMSFTGPEDELVQVRLKAMRAQGFAFAAAAGNEGPAAAPSYPAAYPEVVAVTAIGKDMRVYSSANRGQYVDVAAPGVRIWTAAPGAREGYRTGTSFATPFATAILALQGSETLSASEEELLDHMRTAELGPAGRDAIYGRGLLQAPDQCAANSSPIAVSAPATGSTRR